MADTANAFDRFNRRKSKASSKLCTLWSAPGGCTMKQAVKKVGGDTRYNLLKALQGDGHYVVRAGTIIHLFHKDDKALKDTFVKALKTSTKKAAKRAAK